MPKPVDVLIEEAEKKFQEVMDVIHPLPKEKENEEANLTYYQALQELPPLQRALFRQVTPLLQLALETEKEILTTSDSEKLKAEVAHRVLTLAERLITSRVEKPNQTNVLISLSRLPLFKPFSPIQFTAYPQVIHKKELHYVKFLSIT